MLDFNLMDAIEITELKTLLATLKSQGHTEFLRHFTQGSKDTSKSN